MDYLPMSSFVTSSLMFSKTSLHFLVKLFLYFKRESIGQVSYTNMGENQIKRSY